MYNYIISVSIIKMTAYTIQRNAEARIFKNDKSCLSKVFYLQ